MILAAEATGFPALLIIAGIIGLIVALGIRLGGKRERSKAVALFSVAAIALGVLLANVL